MQARRALMGVGQFTPLQLPGLKLWLDASQIAGLVDGDPVATWPDLSGLGNHATQATGSKKPLLKQVTVNGRTFWVVRLDGVDDALSLTSALGLRDSVAIFIVFATSANTTRQTILSANDVVGAVQVEINLNASGPTAPSRGTIIAGAVISYASVTASANTFEILTYRRTGAGSGTHLIAQNGASKPLTNDGATSYTADGTAEIGRRMTSGTQQLAGDVAEMIVCANALDSGAQKRVERYLGARYNLAVA